MTTKSSAYRISRQLPRPCFLRLARCLGSHLRLPLPGEVVIQRGQRDVGQQRGQDPALRGAGAALFQVAVGRHDPGFEERLDQRADFLVLDPPAEPVHEGDMPDFVETGPDVGLQDPVVVTGSGSQVVDLGNSVVRAAVRAEPVRARLEVRLEDGFEHQLQGGLDHPVRDARYPERGACRSSSGSSPAAPVPAGTHQTSASPGSLPGTRPHPGRFSISATVAPSIPGVRDPLFCLHAKPRLGQELQVADEVEQVTEPAGGIFSRPAVQLGLHLPYRAVLGRLPGRRPRLLGAGIPRRIFGHYSSFPDLTRCRPSPCDRLSRPRSTTAAPSRPRLRLASRLSVPAFLAGRRRRNGNGRFPCSLSSGRRVRHPALPLRPRHGYAADTSPWPPIPGF